MKRLNKSTFKPICFFVLLILISCSESDNTSVVPNYVGTWERTWFNSEKNINLKQTLHIEENTFHSTVNIQEGNAFLPYLEYEGTQNVIDNTLEAWITKIGIADNENNLIYSDENDNNFGNIVFTNLNIHSNFIGTYFVDNENLTLRLDMDGDRNVTGDEGLFKFQKVSE